ncbi:MAG TPA: nucleotidyl transferase AbiEii/AbiGii toxin family protein [Baekduia sp.]|nr:nucleotidyl transferase AbiEii/AbiGii toxin family protein [Baekduia sp.]
MTEHPPVFDAEAMVAALARHDLEYLIVGGFAVAFHGVVRGTEDLDIIVRQHPENYRRLARAIEALGGDAVVWESQFRQRELDPTGDFDLARGENYRVRTTVGMLDILHRARGARDFDSMAAVAQTGRLGGVEVRVVGLDDLIAMKREAGRAKDLLDLGELTRIAD